MEHSRMGTWQGASWATLGDSITAANGYQPIVQEALGFGSVGNYGRGGRTMTAGGERDEGATVHVGKQLDRAYECVTIFAGTNDYRLDKPIGELQKAGGPLDIYTFTGAYQSLVEHLLLENPSSRVNLWTPLQRDKDGYDIYEPNQAGHRLIEYTEAIHRVGLAYALPVLDLYRLSGISLPTLDFFTSDRLHPNDEGHRRIAGMAIPFLQSI
jgi:lysophospholipase L1-like esterase